MVGGCTGGLWTGGVCDGGVWEVREWGAGGVWEWCGTRGCAGGV